MFSSNNFVFSQNGVKMVLISSERTVVHDCEQLVACPHNYFDTSRIDP